MLVFCDVIDDCNLKFEIWKICVLNDLYFVGFFIWVKFFIEIVLKVYSMRRGLYLFYRIGKLVVCVLKRWKCGFIRYYK